MALLPERLETRRLRLRAPVPADDDAIFTAWGQDPAVFRYIAGPPHESVADTRRFIAECLAGWQNGTRLVWVLTDRDVDAPIGTIEARPAGSTVALGCVLARSRWGSGLMPEAIAAITDACLARPELFRVEAVCDTENHASARALERSGFVREGRLERYGIHPNISPEPRAVFMYARIR